MSFAQEMKDFLGAASTTSKMFDDASYNKIKSQYQQDQDKALQQSINDPLRSQQEQANLDLTKARTAHIGDASSTRALTNQLKQLQIEGMKRVLAPQTDAVAASISTPSTIRATTAIPSTSANGGAYGGSATPGPYTPAIPPSWGVGVPQFADGGPVQPQAWVGTPTTAPVPYAPATPAAALQQPTMQQAPQQAPQGAIPAAAVADDSDSDAGSGSDNDDGNVPSSSADLPYSVDAAHDAVLGGLVGLHKMFGLNNTQGVPTTLGLMGARAYARGAGAAPLADMNQIYKKIDPNNQMSDSARNMAALSSVWQYKLKQGDLQGAQRAAAMMLQHYRLASQRYAAISAAAAEHGDVDTAAKAAMKAYANIPDGKDLKITKTPDNQLQYSYVDQNGNQIAGGIVTPQQLAAQAMGVATKGFDQFLIQAAGERLPKGAVGGAGTKPMKPGDLDKVQNDAYNAVDQMASGSNGAIGQNQVPTLKAASYHILQQNPTLDPSEAAGAANMLLTAPADKKGNTPFKITRDDDTGTNQIMFQNGRKITMSDDELRPLMVMRGRIAKQAAAAKSSGKSYGAIGSEIAGAAGRLGKRVGGAALKAGLDPLKADVGPHNAISPKAALDLVLAPTRAAAGAVGEATQGLRPAIGDLGNRIGQGAVDEENMP